MNTKLKIVLGVSVLINLVVFGYWGYGKLKSQQISENKAMMSTEQQKGVEVDLAQNVQTQNFEPAKEEVKEEPVAEETKDGTEEEENKTAKISLSGKTTSSGVSLSWSVNNLGSFDGFKVVKSTEANPVYPGSDYQYLSNKDSRSYSWAISSGSKYHFRVCQYAGGKCVLYSNDIYLDTPEKSDGDGEYASSVSLSLSEEGGKKYLKWSISGGSAPKGYKVVKAKDKNPKYPEDGYYQYISDEDTKKVKLEGFDSGDNYHFRVCIYKGGSCGTYSNDVEVSF